MNKVVKHVMLPLLMLVAACGDFGDTNINPDEPAVVAPETLLTSSLRSIPDVIGSSTGVMYAQHFAQTQYTDGSRYSGVQFDFYGWYTGPLTNLQFVIDLNADLVANGDPSDPATSHALAQTAVARIMKVYFFHHITDRWGPLPFSQALKGEENFEPAYDSQQSIYLGMFAELDEAVAQLDVDVSVEGDFLLGGSTGAWKLFANSLHAIMAMRLSEVDAATAEAEFVKAYDRGVITMDEESVMYPYLSDPNNENPWFSAFETRTDWAITEEMVSWMRFPYGSTPGEDMQFQDPRLDAYADPAPNFGYVVGMPYGIEQAGDIPNDDISFPNYPVVRGQDSDIGIVTTAQMLFTLAEAAYRGWIAEDAGALYEDAIAASLRQWGVYDDASFHELISRPEVAWDASKAMALIHMQKWVALYLQGYEAWSEWRRTGYPDLKPPPNPLNPSGQIPVRQAYPTSEPNLNAANYTSAVQMLGGEDDLNTRLWWDVN